MIESQEHSRTRSTQNLALNCTSEEINESLYVERAKLLDGLDSSVALISQVGDTMHLHQAMKQPDKDKFLKAMEEEIMTHEKGSTG